MIRQHRKIIPKTANFKEKLSDFYRLVLQPNVVQFKYNPIKIIKIINCKK
jgi:hypothetical protein